MHSFKQTMQLACAFCFAILSFSFAQAQNSVGIGTSSPNAKAVLHLEADGSQGLLIPVISTTQRTGMGLAGTDEGMVVFDSGDSKVYYWDGATWVSVGGGTGSGNTYALDLTATELRLLENGSSISSVLLTDLQDGVDDADADPANEIQTITFNATTNILNATSGADPDQAIDLSSLAGGGGGALNDLTDVDLSVAPGNGDVLVFNGSTWQALTNIDAASIDGRGVDLTSVAPTNGQVLKWNGSNWTAEDDITTGTSIPFMGAGTTGVVVGPVSATNAFLRDDGTWAVPGGSGTLVNSNELLFGDGVTNVSSALNAASDLSLIGTDFQLKSGSVTNAEIAAPGGTDKGFLVTNGTTVTWLTTAASNKVFGTDQSNALSARSVVLSTAASIDNTGIRDALTASDANLVSELAVREALDLVSSGSGWALTGNAGTVDGTNFIGTTDNVPFNLRVNNIRSGLLDQFSRNTIFGYNAMPNSSGSENTAIGGSTLNAQTIGNGNVAVGFSALLSEDTGNGNVAIGLYASAFSTASNDNVAVGDAALRNFSSGDFNTAIGAEAMEGNLTGESNTAVGRVALSGNISGSNNTAIGHAAGVSSGALNNATAIGANAVVDASNKMVLGAVGTNIQFDGELLPAGLVGNAGDVLTSAGPGVTPIWSAAGGSGWGLTGNAGTVDGINFIGTTDNVPLSFQVGGVQSGRIEIGNLTANTFLGYSSGSSNTGAFNTGFGWNTLQVNTGHSNTSVGSYNLISNIDGFANTSVGRDAMRANTSGAVNTAHGVNTLYRNTIGNNNTALGGNTMFENTTGSENTAIGTQALQMNTTGISNTATGFYALIQNTADNNVANGTRALADNTTGTGNTAVGHFAGYTTIFANANTTGSNNTFIGYNSGPGTTTQLDNATAIGANAIVDASNKMVLGAVGTNIQFDGELLPAGLVGNPGDVLTSGGPGTTPTWSAAGGSGWGLLGNAGTVDDGTNFIGTTDNVALNFKVNSISAGRIDPLGPTFLGYEAGDVNASINSTGIGRSALKVNTTGDENVAIGSGAMNANVDGFGNTATGAFALLSNTSGAWNTATGNYAMGRNSTGNFNTAIGRNSLFGNTTGTNNTAVGFESSRDNINGGFNVTLGASSGAVATGSYNTFIGSDSGVGTSTGEENVFMGFATGQSNTTGAYNTFIGTLAGSANTNGNDITLLGSRAEVGVDGLTNATAIGANAVVSQSNSLILGNAANVGIGTSTPESLLHTAGDIRSNNNIWVDASALNTGNFENSLRFGGGATGETIASNRAAGANQFGLDFYTGYANRMSITSLGNVGIGTSAPALKLDVVGGFRNTGGFTYLNQTVDNTSGNVGVGFGGYSNAKFSVRSDQSFTMVVENTNPSANSAKFVGVVDVEGDLRVTGNLSKGSGTFKIDHPLDPENKWLYHSFVESPDMMNVYNGNVDTDGNGEAIVLLPSYFESLNKDYRYQLTVVGQFAQAIIGEEVSNNQFVIKTDKPNVKVSWQVTGIRKDPYADQNRVIPEVDKKVDEKGKYAYPKAYGYGPERGMQKEPVKID